ncbi:hypothetical protein LWI28_021441 [Acer negundo]|uniref:Uncharacterized protein n=1 Tax=Acer negundo TaxID=4023 RepID=A0AAD5IDM7_ACENE|nr:hypothetical protein LWI28_021441 [Acer negundo]
MESTQFWTGFRARSATEKTRNRSSSFEQRRSELGVIGLSSFFNWWSGGLKRRLVEDWFGVGYEPRCSDDDSSSGNRSVKGKAPIEPRCSDDDSISGNRSVKAKAPIEPRRTYDDDDTPLAVEVMIIDVMCSDDYKCDASSGGSENGICQGDSQSDLKITESVSELPCGEGEDEDGCSIRPKAALNSPAFGLGGRKKRRLAETR